ncbi:MAG TPA: KilA-N domain-containing protein [Campylobacterales bacterium]|nr:KilA-N domain-containing protein [Campylobacterales bacterium]
MKNKLKVQEIIISVSKIEQEDYISLTDMARYKPDIKTGLTIQNWLRNQTTIEFLTLWEEINNPNFKVVENDYFKEFANTRLSVQEWIEKTNAIGIISKRGRYGGTYAHKDIALEFATWLSPKFKLYLIKEFQRLKENEADSKFKFQRIISKRNYKIQTQSIKDHLIPKLNPNENKTWVYASEADLLNLVLWGKTAKQWREENPDKPSDTNIRDYATVDELIVLSNIEVLNSELIKNNVPKKERIQILQESVISQFKALSTLKPITFEEIAGIEK